jgi:hypothetical protein
MACGLAVWARALTMLRGNGCANAMPIAGSMKHTAIAAGARIRIIFARMDSL